MRVREVSQAAADKPRGELENGGLALDDDVVAGEGHRPSGVGARALADEFDFVRELLKLAAKFAADAGVGETNDAGGTGHAEAFAFF